MDLVFAVRQFCEKYLANGNDVFWAFMDFEKAYDTIDQHGMWQMLRVNGVGGKLLIAVQSFYVDSRACVRVRMDVNEWFPVNVGLTQGCVMSPWLFNVYMDGVVREVNVRVLGKGLKLLSVNGGRFEIIIYHDFLPPPSWGSHVKSNNTHTIIKHTSLCPYI